MYSADRPTDFYASDQSEFNSIFRPYNTIISFRPWASVGKSVVFRFSNGAATFCFDKLKKMFITRNLRVIEKFDKLRYMQ